MKPGQFAARRSNAVRRAVRLKLAAAAVTTLAIASGARAGLSFNVDRGTFDTDARYNAAVAAMQNVVNRYNTYGDFGNYNIYVYYNAGIPTAQASYEGSIGFGSTYPNDRVTQHESNHYLGSGTYWNWGNQFDASGAWTGTRVSQLIQQFDGVGAKFYRSGVHFYPYGLNYDSEVTDDSIFMRNIALMYAMRQDMGNGNQANPWSATTVTLTGSDTAGTSAFNWFGGGLSGTYKGWNDKFFAHAGAAYSTGAFDIRTPNGYPSWTFAGDSLTINSGGRLLFNGYGTAGVVTINNLILDGGIVRHDQFSQDLFQLAGNVTLASSSTFEAANGNMVVAGVISGTGALNKTGAYTLTLTGQNTFTGGTNVNAGTLAVNASNGLRGTLNIAAGATVRLNAANALGTAPGTSMSQINISGGTLDNASAGANAGAASVALTGGRMTASGGGAFHLNAGGGSVITSNASASSSVISGNVVIRGTNATLPVTVADGAAANDLIISGAISNGDGANGLAKNGPGTLLLSGTNTFTGPTTVNAGTLAFSSSPSTIGSLSLADGATLRVGASAASITTLTTTDLTLGSGGATTLAFDFNAIEVVAPLLNTGTLTLSGAASVSIANGGALSAGSYKLVRYTAFAGGGTFSPTAFSLGPRSSGTLSNDGTSGLFLNVTADRPVWTGRDNGTWAAGLNGANKNWKLQTAGTATDYLAGDNVLFDDTATGTGSISITGGNVTPAAVTFNNSTKNYTVSTTGGFGIAGAGAMTKSGTGTVTLATANTFTGPVTINGGTLYASLSFNPADNAVFSGVSGITVNSGGTLRGGLNSFFGYSGNNDQPITVNSGGTLATDTQGDLGVGLVTLNGGTMTTGGANANAGTFRFQDPTSRLVVTANSTVSGANYKFQNGADISVAGGATLTFMGTITDTNSFGISTLIKNGAGSLLLLGTNTYSGGLTINAGTVSAGTNANLGANAAPLNLNGGTLLTTAGFANTHPISITNAGGTIAISSTGTAGTGQLYLPNADALTGNGPLTLLGNGTLSSTGAGNLRLGSTNNYTGNITIAQGGVLEYGTNGAIASQATVTLNNQGELAVQGNASTLPNAVTAAGSTNTVLSFENGSAGVASGPVTLNTGATLTVGLRDWYNYANVRSGTISGVISGGGNLAVNSGSGSGGTLTLSGVNSFNGNITIDNATLAAGTEIANFGAPAAQINSNLGNLQAANRTITVNNNGVLSLTGGNVLGIGSSQNTLSGLTIVINSGGRLQTGGQSATPGWWNKIGQVQLNGGAIRVGSGANNSTFQSLALLGTVTVGGNTASTISAFSGADPTTTGIHLGQNGAAGQVITFNVADATASAAADLTVSARLLNTCLNLVASGLNKTGNGTLLLSGANTYTGVTTLNAGTLTATSAAYANLLNNAGGTDLRGGRLTFDYTAATSPAAQVKTILQNGYAGRFASGQIRSAQLPANRTLGYGDNGSAVSVLLTLPGDATLDGQVDFNDFLILQNSFGQPATRFDQGNFNYDGLTDFNDFLLLQNYFGQSISGAALPVTAGEVAAMTAFAASHGTVPEPASLAVIGLGAAALLRRRRSA